MDCRASFAPNSPRLFRFQDAGSKELSYADFLEGLLAEEVSAKTVKNIIMRTNLARFPFVKGLDAFDFAYQPSIDKKQIGNISTCHFIEHGENIVILEPPGVGKTHLAVGLGLKAMRWDTGHRHLKRSPSRSMFFQVLGIRWRLQ